MAVFFVIVNTPMYFLFPWTLSFLEDRHQRLVHLRKIRIKEGSSNLPGSQQHQGSDKDTKHSLCTHFLYLRYVFWIPLRLFGGRHLCEIQIGWILPSYANAFDPIPEGAYLRMVEFPSLKSSFFGEYEEMLPDLPFWVSQSMCSEGTPPIDGIWVEIRKRESNRPLFSFA